MLRRLLLACLAAAAIPGPAAGAATPPGTGAGIDREQALAASQAAIGRQLGDYTFTDRDGRRRRLADYRGRPLVVSLVFTSCYHICPTTTQHLRRVVENARASLGSDSFRLVTIGFDTPRDTPEAMARFAREQRVDTPGWDFLSTDAPTMERLAADLGFVYAPVGGGFDHLIQTTVVGPGGAVYRQVYGMEFRVPQLVEPLKELVFGAPPGDSLVAELTSRIRLFCTVYDPLSDSYRFSYSIFVGLAVGLSMGALCLWATVREWRKYRLARARAPLA